MAGRFAVHGSGAVCGQQLRRSSCLRIAGAPRARIAASDRDSPGRHAGRTADRASSSAATGADGPMGDSGAGTTDDAGKTETTGLRPDVRAFVLVVDDEPGVRDSIAAVLQASGFAVASAVDGREAIRVLDELVVDVMVLDVRMPRLGGLALLELLDHPPVTVIVSADPVDASTRARLGAKVRRYLAKPFDPRDLVEAVAAASASRSSRRLRGHAPAAAPTGMS